jgi:hypothetical protein
MFLVVLIKRARKTKAYPDPRIISATPVGTAFAISEKHVFTACSSVFHNGGIEQEIGLLTKYRSPVYRQDIIVVTRLENCSDDDENWAVFQRISGTFEHYVHVCPEDELPVKNDKIGIMDFPVSPVTSISSDTLTVQSLHAKILQYEVLVPMHARPKKRKFTSARVVQFRPVRKVERAMLVIGDRVKGTYGAAYFAHNGKAAAFHVETLPMEYLDFFFTLNRDRCFTSLSRGLVLCRLLKFREWYNAVIVPILGCKAL